MKNYKETKLEHVIINSHKEEMISYMKSHPEDFPEIIELAVSDKQPYSWRAAWILWGCMDKNDSRLRKYVPKILEILPHRKDNQQRELIMILQRMQINEKYEGQLYQICTTIWVQTAKNPSLRFNAFKILVAISKKYANLAEHMHALTESVYTHSLSDSVKKSITKLMKDFN